MTQINAFTGSVLQSTQVQRQESDDKSAQVRRQQDDQKATGADQFEHQVERADAVTPIHEEQKQNSQKKRQSPHQNQKPDDEESDPHLDLTA